MSDASAPDTVLRFSLRGLVLFSVSLVAAGGALTFASLELAAHHRSARSRGSLANPFSVDASPEPAQVPPWGELVVREIELERPEEYVAFDIEPKASAWVFPGADSTRVGTVLEGSGVDPAQVARALSPSMLSASADALTVHPDEAMLLSLSAETRSRLYRALAASVENKDMRDPYRSHPGDLERWFAGAGLDPTILAMVKRLSYPRGKTLCFSDFQAVLAHISRPDQRILFAKTLSRQRALLLRLRVRPTTDVERLLGYWSVAGVRAKDLRPLLESIKRLPQGGSTSVYPMLPPFARQRLYTYPTPGDETGNESIDCHYSTLNFFNEVPDPRFADPAFAVPYITSNFYKIAAPSRYGDRIFLVDDKGQAVHSAVYIADDIVFTKNGYGFGQPWMLMHLHDMLDIYDYAEPLRMTVYRDKAQ